MSDPAKLPGGAPAALREFVACTTDSVELDLADMEWIPKPPGMAGLPDPGVSVNDGWTPTTATIKIGWGFVALELPASIVDGELRLDTSNLMIEGIGQGIDKWVDAFNHTLRANGKRLDSFDVRGGKVVMTKRPAAAAAESEPTASAAPVTSAVPGTAAAAGQGGKGSKGSKEEEQENKKPVGCAAKILAGFAAIAVAIGLYAATSGGDDDTVSTGTSDPVAASTSTTTPIPTTTSPPAPTTTVQVGQAASPEPEPQVACGEFPAGSAPGTGGYITIESPATCTATPDYYASASCNPMYLPCSTGQAPGFISYGGTGTNHGKQVADADTGANGASTQAHAAYVRMFGPGPHVLRIRTTCGGDSFTGQAPVNTAGATVVEHPLNNYGGCNIDRLEAAAEQYIKQNDVDLFDPAAVGRAAAAIRDETFDVDATEADPPDPDVAGQYTATSADVEILDEWADGLNTINNTLGAAEVTDDCLWFFAPPDIELLVKVLDGCSNQDHYWVFAGGLTDVEVTLSTMDTPIATTSSFANPLGVPEPAIFDTQAFDTGGPLFNNTVFPCGFGHVAYTACPPDPPPVDAGAFVTVSAAMVDTVSLTGDGAARSHTIDFGPSSGPSYTLIQQDDGWLVESSTGSTQARALFRDNSITLVTPQAELPEGPLSSIWSTTVDGETLTQPAVPVVGLITTPQVVDEQPVAEQPVDDEPGTTDAPVDPPAAIETLESFYEQLSPSVAAGDLGFALDRLHPIVFEAYPTECPAALESFADPELVITLVSDNGPEPWTWELSDGRSFDVPDAISVTLRLTGRGQSGAETASHVALVDGEYHWFTLCA